MLQALIQAFSADSDFQTIVSGIRSGMREQLVAGLTGSSRQVMLASLYEELRQPLFVVTHNMFSAQKVFEDLVELVPPGQVLLFPAQELLAAEAAIASPEMLAQRIDALSRLAAGFRGIVVVPYAGMRRLLPNQEAIAAARFTIQVGQSVELESWIERLVEFGYERVERVENKGEMSVRGGIVDLFPLTSPHPFRIELFDVEVDSIRSFDAGDQRSMDKFQELTIVPCREIVADRNRLQKAAQHAYELLQEQLNKMTDRTAKDRLLEGIGHEIEQMRQGQHVQGMFKYMSLLFPERQTLLDYMPKDTVLLIDEPARLLETAKQLEKDEAEWMTMSLSDGKYMPQLVLSKPYETLLHRKPYPTLYLSLFLRQVPGAVPQNIINFMCRVMQNFHGQMNLLKSEMERWKKAGAKVMMLAGGPERVERIKRVLDDYHIEEPMIVEGNLQTGFELPGIHLVIITEGEMFTQKQRKARKVDKKDRECRADQKLPGAEGRRLRRSRQPRNREIRRHRNIRSRRHS